MPKQIPLSTEQLQKLAQQYGTPFHIYDESGIRAACKRLKEAFADFPNFREFYAVKALPNPAILKIMQSEGFGFDCASAAELWIADQLNIPGQDIMYTSNYTSQSDLDRALDQGVIMNLDDISLLDHLREVPELISFRVNPGIGKTTSGIAGNVLAGPDAKYGVPRDQIVEAYRRAKEKGATRFGIHMMTGSCVMDPDHFTNAVKELLDIRQMVTEELGIYFEFMNIGGGFGIPYRPDEPELNIEQIAQNLKELFENSCNHKGHPHVPKLYMEHGRYFTGPNGWLVSKCEVIKEAYDQRYYGLDACMTNLMRPGMYGAYHHITIPAKEGGEREPGNVVGNLCENNDWFAKQRDLPKAEVGDLFVIHDTGAHGHSMGFNYNGKLRSAELLIREDGSVNVIRDHQSIESLFNDTYTPNNL